jgi:hypothetical protein
VKEDLNNLKLFIVRYNSDFNYDTTEDWAYSWTFAKALLFTLTIMTTIGVVLEFYSSTYLYMNIINAYFKGTS